MKIKGFATLGVAFIVFALLFLIAKASLLNQELKEEENKVVLSDVENLLEKQEELYSWGNSYHVIYCSSYNQVEPPFYYEDCSLEENGFFARNCLANALDLANNFFSSNKITQDNLEEKINEFIFYMRDNSFECNATILNSSSFSCNGKKSFYVDCKINEIVVKQGKEMQMLKLGGEV